MPEFLAIGHRGAAGHEPENTLRSIRKALELGAQAVEIDVYFIDGQLVVFHDATLERTTNGRGRLSRMSFAKLRLLDAGKGEQIPTLEEVIETIGRRAVLHIELKGKGTAGPVSKVIAQYRSRGWPHDAVLVSSFHHKELATLAGKDIPLGILYNRTPRGFAAFAKKIGATSIHLRSAYATAGLLERAHAHDLKVFVFTVNDTAEIHRLKTLGVDGVFSDFPERVILISQ